MSKDYNNLSHPSENSLNDFIDPEFCSLRYAGIDDAVEMIQRIGKGGMLAKADIKSAFRLLKVAPSNGTPHVLQTSLKVSRVI
jgi:hypothetical protein